MAKRDSTDESKYHARTPARTRGRPVIFGIGTDILRVERVRAVMERHGERFAERILGSEELTIYRRRSERCAARGMVFLATRFAAKEAFSKALGLGMRSPMTWQAVQILKAPSGRPMVVVRGDLDRWMRERRLVGQVSLSDERDYVVAFAIVETETM